MDGSPENDQQVQDAPEPEASDRPSPPAEEEDLREDIAQEAEERDVHEVAEEAAAEDELPAGEDAAPEPGAGGEPEEHDVQAPEQAQEASVMGFEEATEQQRAAVMEEMAEQHAEEQDEDAAPAAEEAATHQVEEPDEPVAEEPVHAEAPTEAPTEAEKSDEEQEAAVTPGEPAAPPEEAPAPPDEEEAPAHAADQEAREAEEQPPAEEPHAPAGVVDEPEAPAAEAEATAEPEPEARAEPAEPEEEEEAAVPDDPFSGPGDWYVIHTYSGYENKVKANLGTRIQSMQMQDKIFDVVIPLEDVMEVKGGKKQVVKKKVFPGYLLVRMDYDDDSWYVVRNTPGVTGFVSSGTGQKPTPLPRHEVEKFLAPKEEEAKPQFRLEFEEGDVVRIIAGPFADFNGTISEINVDQSKVKVMVNIFDRETPVELSFDQVARV